MLKTVNFLLFVSAIRPGVCDYLRKLQVSYKTATKLLGDHLLSIVIRKFDI